MANRITWTIGFNTEQQGLNNFKKSLQAMQKEINKLSSAGNLTPELEKSAKAADDLVGILNKSWNTKLQQFNLSDLNKGIKSTYGSMSNLKQEMDKLGISGQQAYQNFAREILHTNTQIKESSKLLDDMATSMANTVKWGITSSIFNNITGSIQQAYYYVKDLDASLNDIRIVTDKSAESMQAFAKQANSAAKELGASTLDYTDASLIFYQQGLSDEETAARAEVTLKTANVTRQSAQEVSEQLTAIWNGYKVSANEAELYIDKVAAVAATTAADLEELSTGMSKVASSANMMGVDIDQLNAQLATIVSVTRQAPETTGAALKTIYARMSDLKLGGSDEDGMELGDVTSKLEKVGIQVLDTSGDLRDMGDVIEDIGVKWTSWGAAQQTAIAQAIAGKHHYNNLIALFENWDMYEDALNTSANSMGTLQEQNEIYMDSIRAHLKELSTETERTFDILADEDAINGLIDSLSTLVKGVNDFLDSFGSGPQLIARFGGVFATVFNKQIAGSIIRTGENLKKFKELFSSKDLKNQSLEAEGMVNSEAGTNAYKEELKIAQQILQVQKGLTQEKYNELMVSQKEVGELVRQLDELKSYEKVLNEIGMDKDSSSDDISARYNVENENLNEQLRLLERLRNSITDYSKNSDITTPLLNSLTILQTTVKDEEKLKEIQEYINKLFEEKVLSSEDLLRIQQIQGAEVNNQRQLTTRLRTAAKNRQEIEDGVADAIERQVQAKEDQINLSTKEAKTQISISNIIKGIGSFSEVASSAMSIYSELSDATVSTADKLNTAWSGAFGLVSGIADYFAPGTGILIQGIGEAVKQSLDFFGAWDWIIKIFETPEEKIERLTKATEESTNELKNTENELKTIEDRINELNSKDKLTWVEGEELNNLRIQNALLKEELETKRKINLENVKEELNTKLEEYKKNKNYNEAFNSSTMIEDSFIDFNEVIGFLNTDIVKEDFISDEVYQNRLEAQEKLKNILSGDKEAYIESFSDYSFNTDYYENAFNNEVSNLLELYKEKKTFIETEMLNLLERGLTDTDYYKLLYSDLVSYATLMGDNETLATIASTAEAMNEEIEGLEGKTLSDFITEGIKSGKVTNSIESLKEYLGEELYKSFVDMCDELGIDMSSVLTGMYTEAVDNIDPKVFDDYLVKIADNIPDDYETLISFTNKLNEVQKKLFYEITQGAESAEEAILLYQKTLYSTDRNSFIQDLFKQMNLGMGSGQELEKYINSLSQEDYSLLLSLDLDYSRIGLRELKEELRKVQEDFTFSLIFDTAVDEEGTTFEEKIDNYKKGAEELRNVMTSLQEGTYQGDFSELSDWIDVVALSESTDKVTFLQEGIDSLKSSLQTLFENLISGKDVSDETKTYIQSIIDSIGEVKQEIIDVQALIDDFNSTYKNLWETSMSGELFSEEELESLSEFIDTLGYSLSQFPEYFDVLKDDISTISNISLQGTQDYLYALKDISEAMSEWEVLDAVNLSNGIISEIQDLTDFSEQQDEVFETMTKEVSNFSETFLESFKLAEVEVNDIVDDLQDKMSELVDAEYQVNIKIHSDAEQSFEDTIDVLNAIEEQAAKIGESYIVAGEDIRSIARIFPGILEDAVDLKNGTIQLNAESTQAAISAAQARANADAEATREELENQANTLRNKAVTYSDMARIAGELAKFEELSEAEKSDKIAELSGKVSDLQTENNDEVSKNSLTNDKIVVDNSDTNAGILAANWAEAYQAAAKASTDFARIAVQNNIAAQGDNERLISRATIGRVSYRGNKGVSTEVSETENIKDAIEAAKDDDTGESWAQLSELFNQLAASANKQADDIEAMMAGLGVELSGWNYETNNISEGKGPNYKPEKESNKKGDSGKKGSEPKDPDVIELFKGEADRYHDVNIELAQIATELERIEKEQEKLTGQDLIDNLDKQLELLEAQKAAQEEKLRLAKGELIERRLLLMAEGVTFGSDGSIANYNAMLAQKEAAVNAAINAYNAMSAEEQKAYKDVVDKAQEDYDNLKKQMDEYDNLLTETIPELTDEIQDSVDKELEVKLQKFNLKVDVALELSEATRDWNDFKKEIIDGIEEDDIFASARADAENFFTYFNQEGTGSVQSLAERVNSIMAELNEMDTEGSSDVYGEDRAKALEDLKKSNEDLQKALEESKEIVDDTWDSYLDSIDEAQDAFDEHIEQYEHITDLIEHDMNLINLIYGDDAYSDLIRFYEAQRQSNLSNIEFQKQQVDLWKEQMDAVEEGSEDWETFKENWQAATEELNSTVESSIENLLEQYTNTLGDIFKDMNDQVSGGLGLEYIESEWDLINDEAEKYLDSIESAYELQSLGNKYIEAINNTDNVSMQRKLNDLMEEQLNGLREKEKITKYDIERANALYEIALKELALEDAKASKTQLRLNRDAQGNYSYEFIADQESILEAQQALLDAQHEVYTIDKEAYKENLNEILSSYSEFQQELRELYENTTLTEEEREAKRALLVEKYGSIVNGLVRENEQIRVNTQESALLESENLYKLNAENIDAVQKESLDEFLSVNVPGWISGIQNMTDKFAGSGEHGEDGFLPIVEKVLDRCNEALLAFQENLTDIETAAGKDFDNMSDGLNDITTSTDELREANESLIDSYGDEEEGLISKMRNLYDWLTKVADEYKEVEESAKMAAQEAYHLWSAEQQAAYDAAKKEEEEEAAKNNNSDTTIDIPASGSSSNSSANGEVGSASNKDFKAGDLVTYTGSYHYSSWGKSPVGNLGSNKKNAVKIVEKLTNPSADQTHPYLIDLAGSNNSRERALGWIKKDQIIGYDTGGYTGTWGSEGRLAMLHEKELVLNKRDTSNILSAVQLAEKVAETIELMNFGLRSNINSLSNINSNAMIGNTPIEQNVYINADFPAVQSSIEIEQAFNNLVNVASQHVLKR